jgi:hypothetical protein
MPRPPSGARAIARPDPSDPHVRLLVWAVVRALWTSWAVSAPRSRVRVGIDPFVWTGLTPKITADAPVVAAPPTEASPEALSTAQATLDAQLVALYASGPHRRGDPHRPLESALDGVPQRAQGQV